MDSIMIHNKVIRSVKNPNCKFTYLRDILFAEYPYDRQDQKPNGQSGMIMDLQTGSSEEVIRLLSKRHVQQIGLYEKTQKKGNNNGI